MTKYYESDKCFINPYNFIPAGWTRTDRSSLEPDEEIHASGREQEELVSGVLDCTLLTKTPLAVPDTDKCELEWTNDSKDRNKNKKNHKKYRFFHYSDGNPAIPGSTIRGAVRSVYETVTDSCFITSNTDEIITSRSKKPFLPGVLLRDVTDKKKWVLHEAERFVFAVHGDGYCRFQDEKCLSVKAETLRKYRYGQEVSFKHGQAGHRRSGTYVTAFSGDTEKYSEKGYLFLGEKFSRKHFESIFKIKESGYTCEMNEDSRAFLNLLEIHRVYNNEKINKNLENGNVFYGSFESAKENGNVFYSGFESAKEKGAIPIWYSDPKQDGRSVPSLSFASIGRQAYEHTMGDLIQKKSPCRKRDAVCRACALFGMAGEESLGSRIRITDAILKNPEDSKSCFVEGNYHVLKELASPKISYLPFYTNQPGTQGWSYDKEGMNLRGRKYYWHNMEEDAWKAETKENAENHSKEYIRTERNTTMQLVRKDIEFKFHVYYDRITKTQLDELIWTLTLGENEKNSSLCYKIGHGKPIGLGSAKIRIDCKRERSFDQERGYSLKTEDYTEKPIDIPDLKNIAHLKELKKIMDINAAESSQISYPFIDSEGVQARGINDTASHKWFNENYPLREADQVKQQWRGILRACEKPFHAYKLTYEENETARNRNNTRNNRRNHRHF